MLFFFQAEDGIRDDLVTEFRRVLFRSLGRATDRGHDAGGPGPASCPRSVARPRRRDVCLLVGAARWGAGRGAEPRSGGAFAEGARQAAPHALQVADRFHLLQNLGQAFDRFLTREQHVLTHVADAMSAATKEQATDSKAFSPELPGLPAAPTTMTRLQREHAAVEARRQARYERVVAL